MSIAVNIALAMLAQAAVQPAATLRIRVEGAREGGCLSSELLELAVRRQLPGVAIAPGGPLEGDDLEALFQEVGDGWTMKVARADGQPAMSRSVASGSGPCASIADTFALMLDRYLEEINWKGRPVQLGLLPPPEPPALPEGEPVKASAPRRTRLGFFGGPAAQWGAPGPLLSGLGLEVAVFPPGSTRLSLWLLAGDRGSTPVLVSGVERGRLHVRPLVAVATGAFCGERGRWRGCGGGAVGAFGQVANATGLLFQRRDETAVLPGVGGVGRFGWRTEAGFEVALQGLVAFPFGSTTFTVTGTEARAKTPSLHVVVSPQAGWVF